MLRRVPPSVLYEQRMGEVHLFGIAVIKCSKGSQGAAVSIYSQCITERWKECGEISAYKGQASNSKLNTSDPSSTAVFRTDDSMMDITVLAQEHCVCWALLESSAEFLFWPHLPRMSETWRCYWPVSRCVHRTGTGYMRKCRQVWSWTCKKWNRWCIQTPWFQQYCNEPWAVYYSSFCASFKSRQSLPVEKNVAGRWLRLTIACVELVSQ